MGPVILGTGFGWPLRSSAVPGLSMSTAVQRGRESVGVALPADLAVGDDVQPGVFLRPDRQQRRVVLRLLEELRLHSP